MGAKNYSDDIDFIEMIADEFLCKQWNESFASKKYRQKNPNLIKLMSNIFETENLIEAANNIKKFIRYSTENN